MVKGVAAGTAALACARLAQELRRLRVRTGLSMAALAKETAYRKSSWERYLNGGQLAPRQAVESLCAMAGEPPERLECFEPATASKSGRKPRGEDAQRFAAGLSAPAVQSSRLLTRTQAIG